MELHERMTRELFEQKSVDALIWLIEAGRELEFSILGRMYFISCDGAEKCVSIWDSKSEQSFNSVEELTVQATIDGQPFLNAWKDAVIETLF